MKVWLLLAWLVGPPLDRIAFDTQHRCVTCLQSQLVPMFHRVRGFGRHQSPGALNHRVQLHAWLSALQGLRIGMGARFHYALQASTPNAPMRQGESQHGRLLGPRRR